MSRINKILTKLGKTKNESSNDSVKVVASVVSDKLADEGYTILRTNHSSNKVEIIFELEKDDNFKLALVQKNGSIEVLMNNSKVGSVVLLEDDTNYVDEIVDIVFDNVYDLQKSQF